MYLCSILYLMPCIMHSIFIILCILSYRLYSIKRKIKKNSLKKIFLDLQKMEYFKRIIEFFFITELYLQKLKQNFDWSFKTCSPLQFCFVKNNYWKLLTSSLILIGWGMHDMMIGLILFSSILYSESCILHPESSIISYHILSYPV